MIVAEKINDTMRLFGDNDITTQGNIETVDDHLKRLGLPDEGSELDEEEYKEFDDEEEKDELQDNHDIGPHGEIYASSESSGASDDSEIAYISRAQMRAYKEAHGLNLKKK